MQYTNYKYSVLSEPLPDEFEFSDELSGVLSAFSVSSVKGVNLGGF